MLGFFIALFLIGAAMTTGCLAAARGAAIAAFAGASVAAAASAKTEAPSGTCVVELALDSLDGVLAD
jgi:uncharacterized membrane protein